MKPGYKTRKINRSFNTWAQRRSEEGPPDDTHYSITRDRGTVVAERLLARLTKPGGRMLVPPPLPRARG